MPLYEYQCESCGTRFERIQKFSDPPVDVCPNCGAGPVKKLLSSPAIQFKGSGFYITDYARSGGGDKSEKPHKSEGEKKTEKTSGDSAGTSSGSGSSTSSTSSSESSSSSKAEPSSKPAKPSSD